jgi:hypothetical protein
VQLYGLYTASYRHLVYRHLVEPIAMQEIDKSKPERWVAALRAATHLLGLMS